MRCGQGIVSWLCIGMIGLFPQLASAQSTTDAARLAPTAEDWRAASADADAALDVADAAMEAVGSVHNAFVAAGANGTSCEVSGSLAARSVALGTAWRDATQAARLTIADAAPMLEAPTLAPLVSTEDRSLRESIRGRVVRHERALGEASTWHRQYLAGLVRRCGATLKPAAGFARQRVMAQGELGRDPVMLLVAEGLELCTDGVARGAGPVFVVPPDSRVCGAPDDQCSCMGQRADPAAVLGTTTTP